MASSDIDYDLEALMAKLKLFAKTQSSSKDDSKMDSKTAGKMAKECWPKALQPRVDSSVFPKVMDKTNKSINLNDKDKVKMFISESAKQYDDVTKKTKEFQKHEKLLADKIISAELGIKKTAISKTGGVDKMTDSSQYTGAHKERFDASGKGKGAEGRTDKADNSGYVGNYKGDGSYGKK